MNNQMCPFLRLSKWLALAPAPPPFEKLINKITPSTTRPMRSSTIPTLG